MPLPLVIAAGAAVLRGAVTAATLAPLVKPAIGVAKRFIKQQARPGIGSKVTKGPLMLGKQKLIGPSRPGLGRVLGAAGAVGTVGVVASHRSPKPATQTRPQPARTSGKKTSTSEKKCCPLGTKRMVCFKRGRVKKRKSKPRKAAKRKKSTRKRKG